ETVAVLAEMHREGVKIKPRDLRPALPETAQNLILETLSFVATNRPKDARTFAEGLESSLNEANQVAVRQPDANKFENETVRKRGLPKNERFTRRLLAGGAAL